MENIIIKNAYENNLKHISLEIPLNSFTCVTGCSGCGKSSLVFDTIYAESQRGLLEGMSGNIQGQKLMNKPKVEAVENLRPALNISQNYYNVNPRSTVGTTTEISYYLRALFSIVNSDQNTEIPENTFSSNNPKSFCPHCSGLGVEESVSEERLIPDWDKTLREGAILFFKGPSEGKEQKMLLALCEQYGIDIDKKVSQLSKDELHKLLYADDEIRYKLSYKEGKRSKKHYVYLRGAIASIKNQKESVNSSETSNVYTQYIEEVPCHVCGGAKLSNDSLKYKVGGLNYAEVEQMELSVLHTWLRNINDERIYGDKKELVNQLVNSILHKLNALLQLNVDYLSLCRSIPSLSGGERQRVRIASQLTCSLKGLIYILDEPCKGLHYKDTNSIIKATRDLVKKENTIIAIEHNKKYINAADNIVELGPVGGPQGGYLLERDNDKTKYMYSLSFKKVITPTKYFTIAGINFRNIKDQDVSIPIGSITCITGVSGSGKSSLAEVIAACFEKRSSKYCKSFHGGESIKRLIRVNQAPIGKNPRSTVVSYLGIYDDIRKLFAETESAKKTKLSAAMFSMNREGGRCECCQGTGLQKIELNYLPSSYITCPECEGKRFNEKVLSVKYQGKTIHDVLETPISDILDVFDGTKKIYRVLNSMVELGLGYLKLGQMSMNLSGGEAQRVKLAKALGTSSTGKNVYILDEPTSGLNDVDIDKFIKVLFALQAKKETIIQIEHNPEFIAKVADYIVDFGLHGGKAGGKVIAQGTPETVFKHKDSSLHGLDNI